MMPSPEIRILMDSFDRISDQALRRELIAMAECLATMTEQGRTTAR